MFTFISYSGCYPHLCFGILDFEFNSKYYSLKGILCSGGNVYFTNNYAEEHVEQGEWKISDYDYDDLPEEIKEYKTEFLEMINDNISHGCCGGCI